MSSLARRGVPKTWQLHVDSGPNSLFVVIPAKAGIQKKIWKKNSLDTRFRGYDGRTGFASLFDSDTLGSHFTSFRFA
jgi:hypothetical protein